MNELILSFLIIAFAFTGLAVGLIFKNQPIKGSCGGMANLKDCLLYTSPSPRDATLSRMPSSA